MTEWRAVVGYEGRYEVSSRGAVRSVMRGSPRELKLFSRHAGHLAVSLYKDGKFKQGLVHRLVLEAFTGPCPVGMVCRHLNGDPTDNRVENLSWGTPSQNVQDSIAHGTHWHSSKMKCPNGHPYSKENTYRYRGRRYCRACTKERLSRFREARSA